MLRVCDRRIVQIQLVEGWLFADLTDCLDPNAADAKQPKLLDFWKALQLRCCNDSRLAIVADIDRATSRQG